MCIIPFTLEYIFRTKIRQEILRRVLSSQIFFQITDGNVKLFDLNLASVSRSRRALISLMKVILICYCRSHMLKVRRNVKHDSKKKQQEPLLTHSLPAI